MRRRKKVEEGPRNALFEALTGSPSERWKPTPVSLAVQAVKRGEESGEDYLTPIWNRVAHAALKGGATEVDVFALAYKLGMLESTSEIYKEIAPDAHVRQRQRKALANKKTVVKPDERTRIADAARRLAREHPKKASLYRAVETETGVRVGRIRYILEGPRRVSKSR